MSGNAYRVVVELPKSDRFHSRDDAHLAQIVTDAVQYALRDRPGCTVRFERVEDGE